MYYNEQTYGLQPTSAQLRKRIPALDTVAGVAVFKSPISKINLMEGERGIRSLLASVKTYGCMMVEKEQIMATTTTTTTTTKKKKGCYSLSTTHSCYLCTVRMETTLTSILSRRKCLHLCLRFRIRFIMGPWYSGTQCGMRIPRPEFKSQRVP